MAWSVDRARLCRTGGQARADRTDRPIPTGSVRGLLRRGSHQCLQEVERNDRLVAGEMVAVAELPHGLHGPRPVDTVRNQWCQLQLIEEHLNGEIEGGGVQVI